MLESYEASSFVAHDLWVCRIYTFIHDFFSIAARPNLFYKTVSLSRHFQSVVGEVFFNRHTHALSGSVQNSTSEK
jgi:hypothetical protein